MAAVRKSRSVQGKATFRGHPLHLMLVSFPVAFWSGAVATDIAGARSLDPFWYRMSVTLIAMGVAGGALASAFGTVDYATVPMSRRAKRVATSHLVASTITLALYIGALLLRGRDDASVVGIAFSYAGAATLLVGGYWGSELANRHRVGIAEAPATPPDNDARR